MMNEQFSAFDQEFSLQQLLAGINTEKLLLALQHCMLAPVAILDNQNQTLLSSEQFDTKASSDYAKLAIIDELETIGYIQSPSSSDKLEAAGQLIQLILFCNKRYLLASSLHIQTQQDDYEELQRRHTALEQSEKKYKALAESLDIKVTKQVKTIEKAQVKLYESEKLASVGRLAAGVAHEINNPIGFIRSNLSSAHSYLNSFKKLNEAFSAGASSSYLQHLWQEENLQYMEEDLNDIINESIEGVDRVADIIKDLKSFSRVNDADEEVENINKIIRQTCHVAESQVKEKLQIILELGDIPAIFCQPAQLGQLFLNLLLNAADAMAEKGKIRFKTYLKETHICIEIRDNGCGIEESDLSHIFEPFFTTKEVGKGIGLGLTVCLNIVQAHQGELAVVSKPLRGSLVTILLPVHLARDES